MPTVRAEEWKDSGPCSNSKPAPNPGSHVRRRNSRDARVCGYAGREKKRARRGVTTCIAYSMVYSTFSYSRAVARTVASSKTFERFGGGDGI